MLKITSRGVLQLKRNTSLHVLPALGGESPTLSIMISTPEHDYELPTRFQIDSEDMVTLLLQVADLKEILSALLGDVTVSDIKSDLRDSLTRKMDNLFEAEVFRFVRRGKSDDRIFCHIRLKSHLIETVSTQDGDYDKPTLADLASGFEIDRKALAQAIYENGYDTGSFSVQLPPDDKDEKYESLRKNLEKETMEKDVIRNCPVCGDPLDVEGNCRNECVVEEMEEPDEQKCPQCGKVLNRDGSCPNGCI